MCIAILNTKEGGLISRDTLQTCWDGNRDGAGICYPLHGNLVIAKELKSFKKFYKIYENARALVPEANMIIHFRIKTHGLVDKNNCHPFLVHDELAFAHNGMIDGFDCKEKKKSDTVLFMEKVLRNLPKNFLEYEGCRRLIRKSTGWSKFIFLTAAGEYRIINEEGGTWDGGNWFSNGTYKVTNYRDYGGTRVYYQGTMYNSIATPPSRGADTTYWQNKYGSARGTGAFKEDGTPLETEKWPEKEYADFHDTGDELPFKPDEKNEKYCSECYTALSGKMENHYGVCTKCLRDYELIPKSD